MSEISHGVFERQNAKFTERIVNDPFTRSFGLSVGLSISQIYQRKILFRPFLAKKETDADRVGRKFCMGFLREKKCHNH